MSKYVCSVCQAHLIELCSIDFYNLITSVVFSHIGGRWRCLHIDDPRTPEIRLPSLSSCMQYKPHQIIDKLISRLPAIAAAAAPMEMGDTGEDGDEFDGLRKFIIKCIPTAVSIITTDQHYDRVDLLKRLLSENKGLTWLTSFSHNASLFPAFLYSVLAWFGICLPMNWPCFVCTGAVFLVVFYFV